MDYVIRDRFLQTFKFPQQKIPFNPVGSEVVQNT